MIGKYLALFGIVAYSNVNAIKLEEGLEALIEADLTQEEIVETAMAAGSQYADDDLAKAAAANGVEQIAAGAAWDNGEVRYCWDKNVNQGAKNGMIAAVNHYHQKLGQNCINFIEIGAEERGGTTYCKGYPNVPSIVVQSHDSGCYSNYLGQMNSRYRSWYRMRINIGRGCESMGVCVHEWGHSIGMAHEQTRPDRDSYIKMQWDNIVPSWKSQFTMNPKAFSKKAYCYESVMHYGAYSAVVNRSKPGMVPHNCANSWEKRAKCPPSLGQRRGLAGCDQEQLAMMYGCKGVVIDGPGSACEADKYSNCADYKAWCGRWSVVTDGCKTTCKTNC